MGDLCFVGGDLLESNIAIPHGWPFKGFHSAGVAAAEGETKLGPHTTPTHFRGFCGFIEIVCICMSD